MWSAPEGIPGAWRRELGAFKEAVAAHATSQKPCYVWFEGMQRKSMSFLEVHSAIQSLAGAFRRAAKATGCEKGAANVVGLVLKRSAALPIAQFASFRAGSTFVPCDPTWPMARTADILTEAGARTVAVDATKEDFEGVVAEMSKVIGTVCFLHIDLAGDIIEERHIGTTATTATAKDVCEAWPAPEVMYIMYTSGSTGKPKGCVVPSSGVWNRLTWGVQLMGHRSDDVFAIKTPCTFDVSIPEMWSPLCLGATSVIVPDGAHMDFAVLKDVMKQGKVTIAEFVPSILAMFLDFVSPGDLPDLRQVICAGEALLLSHREKLDQSFGQEKLDMWNLYGPTEACIEVLAYRATADTQGLTHGFPLGHPPPNVNIYIVDQSDATKLAAYGDVGELCIGGCQVAYGYAGRPELTSERFLPNPFGPPGLLYRTGDLAKVDERGCVSYLGRADRQIKLNGVRIELGEVETVLQKRFSCLQNVAVEYVKQALVAVVTPVLGQEAPEVEKMRKYLSKQVPLSHVPTEWHIRDDIPVTPAGKVDHKRLSLWIEDQQKAQTWGSIYDEMYFADSFQVRDGEGDPTMDWAAYYDSFTGEMHKRTTIEEWVSETVVEVGLHKPSSVLEMGCGKGMILFKMAALPSVKSLVCCDLSGMAIKHVEKLWAWMHETGHVIGSARQPQKDDPVPINAACSMKTIVREASNFAGVANASMDAIVCNGVAMHFPSARYLVDALQNALPKLTAEGRYHLGDVISLHHQPLFLLRRARHMDPRATFDTLQDKAFRDQVLAGAKDRAYSHKLFYGLMASGMLPGIGAVEIQVKQGEVMSEFTRYRYNVILHKGAASSPLSVVACSDRVAQLPTRLIVEGISRLANGNPKAVVACRSIPNARLTADVLLMDGISDAAAPATQVGAGDGGGICPAEIRKLLAAQLFDYHIVLTWSRDGKEDHMDLYALPMGGVSLISGLQAVMTDAVAMISPAELEACSDDPESFSNVLSTVDQEATEKVSSNGICEVRSLWEKGNRVDAVLRLISQHLGQTGDMDASDDFKSSGGNSFVAMQLVGSIRKEFGVSAAVFELLTLSFLDFAKAVVTKSKSELTEEGNWVVEHLGKAFRSDKPCPTFVLFPQAGSSPKQYAAVGTELTSVSCPRARCLYIQPPGRDARASEPNILDNDQYIKETSAALRPFLVGDKKNQGPVVFVGDSWGSIACFCTLHRLRDTDGFVPSHVVISGDASPALASTHNGLGSHSDASMHSLSDEDMLVFMSAAGATIEKGAAQVPDAVLLSALRSDCILYEQYKRAADLKLLPCPVTLFRGEHDGVVMLAEMLGWLEEFEAEEKSVVTIRDATHHLYEEQPSRVAQWLHRIVSACAAK